jgi:hypothetical protein
VQKERRRTSPEKSYIPQLYVRHRQLRTVSALNTRADVMGHTPPLAKVPATTDIILQLISIEQFIK